MPLPDIALLILSVLDAGILLLAYRLDRTMYGPVVLVKNSTLFVNGAYDEPFNRLLLSKGGSLVTTILFLTAVMIGLIR